MRTFLFYLASLLVGLLSAEALLRIAGARFSSSFYVIDPDLGWALRAGASGDVVEENAVHVDVNSEAIRDTVKHSIDKRADVYRIAVIGDSFVEAMQVPLEQTFVKLLESKTCEGRRIEALNFGVQGYGTAQELLTWRLKAAKYKPDAVWLVFYTGNDLYNNQRLLNPTNADAAPYFRLVDGALQMQPAMARESGMREAWASVVRVSKLAQMLTDVYYKFGRQKVRAQEDANRKQFGENYMDRLIYSPPAHDAMREAWAVTEAALPAFRDEVERAGARFHLAIASSGVQVHPDPEVRRQFLEFIHGQDLYYAEHRIAEVASKHGIRATVIGEEMLRAARPGVFFYGFPGNLGKGHWNEAGHRFVTDLIAEKTCSK